MNTWSTFYQNPEFLEKTRINLILDDYRPLILKWCMLKPDMKVLDVGCGTGYYTRFLAEGDIRLNITGIDNDENLIRAATNLSVDMERIDFAVGNAEKLPFEDNSFDMVCSHTFFHAIENPVQVMKEMKRVCKAGGIISTVSPMGFLPALLSRGHYPNDCGWKEELDRLESKLIDTYEKLKPFADLTQGLDNNEVPYFFSQSGLLGVSVYPIGKIFSLSNAAMDSNDKIRYIKLLFESEKDKLNTYKDMPEFSDCFSATLQERYLSLLKEKCDYLLSHLNDNAIWDISGGANLLTVGKVPIYKNMKWMN